MKILIAEDDRISRVFLKDFMEAYGTCDVAVDGMETLDLYLEAVRKKEPYDILCLDIMMPKIDGLKVLRVIRGLEEQSGTLPADHLKIIMMTALAEVNYVKEAFELGCDAYASKPIDTAKVEEVMKNIGLLDEEGRVKSKDEPEED
jgi:two-component system chemotaxis response regulator CheY